MSGAGPFATVSASIEVYPFEGGKFVIPNGQIRQVIFEKELQGGATGRAVIQLALGGPEGPESAPDWIQIMTPMSYVLIGMSRGGRAAVVFTGVVIRPAEIQEWRTSEQTASAGRFQTFECADFAWFFRAFNYYSLSLMGFTTGTAVGTAMGFAPAGLASILDQGLLGGPDLNPADVAQRWYSKVMVGQGAIMGKTYIPYSTGQQIKFGDILATFWENYPSAHVPYFEYFLAAEQSWMDKFLSMLPEPWYEFFITTAPRDYYTLGSGSSGMTTPGWIFSMAGQPLAKQAGPQLVARVNPVPALNINVSDDSGTGGSFGELDMSRWNGLQLFTPDDRDPNGIHVFYESDITFSAEEAKNFYVLNPTAIATYFVQNNANNIPWPFTFLGAADPASVQRYGYRPSIGTFRWFADASGLNAQNQAQLSLPKTVATVLGRYVSWIHPLPLMARAEITMPLTPDVMIGTRWEYAPFKDGKLWQFYVEGVRHNFVFGGRSTTTLSLSRGLPSDIYADSSQGGLLYAIYLGNAMRQNGEYTHGLPANSSPGLTLFTSPDDAKKVAGELAQVFVTPQKQ